MVDDASCFRNYGSSINDMCINFSYLFCWSCKNSSYKLLFFVNFHCWIKLFYKLNMCFLFCNLGHLWSYNYRQRWTKYNYFSSLNDFLYVIRNNVICLEHKKRLYIRRKYFLDRIYKYDNTIYFWGYFP